MTLALELSRAFHATTLVDLPDEVVAHARTVLLDTLACICAGRRTEITSIAGKTVLPVETGRRATILKDGTMSTPASAALVNGAMLRSLDLLDVFVGVDVCHPSEAIPAALACAEARGASGRDFFETVVAALALHCRLASALPLHRYGLHHVGHGAWIVPLVAGRLMGLGPEGSANALNLASRAMFVPEGFSRGQVTNIKALAYPVLARQAIGMAELAEAELCAHPEACEEVLDLFCRATGHRVKAEVLLAEGVSLIQGITLKAYPAQYALQPIIAAGVDFAAAEPGRIAAISRIRVSASRRTVARTADPEKFRPSSAETADHSLPFCLAVALLDGSFTPESLSTGRWYAADVLSLIDKIDVEPVEDDDGFAVGRQGVELTFTDGSVATLACTFPGARTWTEIARDKLLSFAGETAAMEMLRAIQSIELLPDIGALISPIIRLADK